MSRWELLDSSDKRRFAFELNTKVNELFMQEQYTSICRCKLHSSSQAMACDFNAQAATVK
jgi:hypothetical protein